VAIETSDRIAILVTREKLPICWVRVSLLSRVTSEYCLIFDDKDSASGIDFEFAVHLEGFERDNLIRQISDLLQRDVSITFGDTYSRIELSFLAVRPLQEEFPATLAVHDNTRDQNVTLSISNAIGRREDLSAFRQALISLS